ncbi:MAG: zinc ABC transporter solute-binding protein [Desulfobacteraceae bacterium]|nr:zinc ABC transporter substrate-binding protein [Desulfobacteraceae bacterium]MBC2754587.1 zinc ABC transporter solute-binding protein [Desulfobacteraceae bacterium]
MERRFNIYLTIIFILTVCWQNSASADSKINVFVSILPQKYFVESIGGEFIETTVIVHPDQSPADYEPSPSQMIMMSKADIYFAVGVAFETTWLKKFSSINPGMKVVHTDAGIEKRPIVRHENHELNHHEHEQHHHHGPMDPHIWLSPPLVKIQAEHIKNGLISIDPTRRKIYEKNYSQFIAQIESLDKELKTLFSENTRAKKFLVFHPSWGYFADAYGLTQISIEIEGKTPKAREVKNLIEFARQHHIELIFIQPQFSTKHAEIIANEINGQVVFADPLAKNWYNNIQAVALSIKQALK